MISLWKDSSKAAKDIQALSKEIEQLCNNAVRTVRTNGVVLEELKNNNYLGLSKRS
jgi:hypothetical protein